MNWRPVLGYEAEYKVSDSGEVFSVRSNRLLKPLLCSNRRGSPYRYVDLMRNGQRKRFKIAYLVLREFFGERPKGMDINHKDGSKMNDALHNLEYCTRSANMLHAFSLGLIIRQGRKDRDFSAMGRKSLQSSKRLPNGRFGARQVPHKGIAACLTTT